jgi:hypothetical protein
MPLNRRRRLREVSNMKPVPPSNITAYEIQVHPLPLQPHEPEQFYWHLFYKGEKVNGGISDTEGEAWQRAVRYKMNHNRDEFLRRKMMSSIHSWEHV